MRTRLAGGNPSHYSLPGIDQLAPDLKRIVDEALWGSVWTRPGLDTERRCMCTVAALTALGQMPLLGQAIFKQDLLVYLMYLTVPLAAFLLYRTRLGLNVRAVGEDPDTADAMGISVTRTRYFATIGGGMLMGLGGAHLSLAYTPGWTENLTGGRGWIAIALVIFATWDPARALLGALIFGGVNAIQFRLQAAGGGVIPAAMLAMMPYLLTIVVLTLITVYENVSRRLGAPAALGLPYMRGER